MTLNEAEKIKRCLEELIVDVEYNSWGPTYEIAQREQRAALRIIRREIKELKKCSGNIT
jgi:hypothetical protein